MLRTPLSVTIAEDEGILTGGSASSAYVTVTNGTATGDERLRIQVLQDLIEERLLFSLLDMKEGGAAGAAVSVTQNGDYTLTGFANSAVSSLDITVDEYAALWELVRNSYGGRLVDVLDIETA